MNFSIQTYSKIINNWILNAMKAKGYLNKIFKTLIIICLGICFQLCISSCRTCKCPAYSEIITQYSPNLMNLTT